MAVLSIPLVIIGYRVERLRQQKEIIALLIKYVPYFDSSDGYITQLDFCWPLHNGHFVDSPKDNDLVTVAKAHKLERLYLSGNDITDDGLDHLKKLRNLEILDIYGTQITEEGVSKLRRVLPDCEIRLFDAISNLDTPN